MPVAMVTGKWEKPGCRRDAVSASVGDSAVLSGNESGLWGKSTRRTSEWHWTVITTALHFRLLPPSLRLLSNK